MGDKIIVEFRATVVGIPSLVNGQSFMVKMDSGEVVELRGVQFASPLGTHGTLYQEIKDLVTSYSFIPDSRA